MRKRGTISRCCCKEPTAGFCNDACVYDWNGEPVSSNGEVIDVPPFTNPFNAYVQSYNTGDWVGAGYAGSDGNFASPSRVGFLEKLYDFDYRTVTSHSFSVRSILPEHGNNNGRRTEVNIFPIVPTNIAIDSDRIRFDTAASIVRHKAPVTIFSGLGVTFIPGQVEIFQQPEPIEVGDTVDIEIVTTWPLKVDTRVLDFSAFNGLSNVEDNGCADRYVRQHVVSLNGVEVATVTAFSSFVGKLCAARTTIATVEDSDRNGPETSLENMVISAT